MREACEDLVGAPQVCARSVSVTGILEPYRLTKPPSVSIDLGERCVRADEIDDMLAAGFLIEKTPIARAIVHVISRWHDRPTLLRSGRQRHQNRFNDAAGDYRVTGTRDPENLMT